MWSVLQCPDLAIGVTSSLYNRDHVDTAAPSHGPEPWATLRRCSVERRERLADYRSAKWDPATPMSAMGQTQTFAVQKGVSALPTKADIEHSPCAAV